MPSTDYSKLEEKAKSLRRKTLELAVSRNEGHIGGAYSSIELMISLFEKMKSDDTFILSKGHCCLPYFLLLREQGYNPAIGGHPEIDPANGIPCTTGSLGQGFPMGLGMALARKIMKKPGHVYVMMSDAEFQEGTTYETLLLGSHHKLDNLSIVVDNNGKQTLGDTSKILALGNLAKKVEAFDWQVREFNGHSFPEIFDALSVSSVIAPTAYIGYTVKGKGVSFMEDSQDGFHTRIPKGDQLEIARRELA